MIIQTISQTFTSFIEIIDIMMLWFNVEFTTIKTIPNMKEFKKIYTKIFKNNYKDHKKTTVKENLTNTFKIIIDSKDDNSIKISH